MLEKVIKSLVEKVRNGLKETEFEEVKIDSEDISENVKRNTIKLFCEAKYSKEMMTEVTTVSGEIFYFAPDTKKYKVKCVRMQNALKEILLSGIEVDGESLEINHLSFTTTNKVLVGNFEIENRKAIMENDDEIEMMENLKERF